MADGTQVDLGHAMITMVEPTRDPDRLREYNRWYEYDHAYSGVMLGPWAFSYRRWVATKPLKALRYPNPSTVADPVSNGSFIAFYWYLKDKVDEHFAWSFPQAQWLGEQGRMNAERTHVSTSLYDFRGAVNRPSWPVPPQVSLDHPYQGLVVAWLDRAADASYDDLDSWTRDKWLPSLLTEESPIAQALVFAPRDFPGAPNTGVGVGEKLCCALFLQCDPRDAWAEHFTGFSHTIAESGVGRVGLVAPFIPVVPGTNTYLDELW
ncbi:MAG TPA: hypothetical protein VGQ20_06755 [Acidimicrobiales bacterium]|jgi:hypothetical protein|nr:hypothetical protein [Acidimicrobiales bacterium]